MRGPAKYIAALERREQHLIKRTAEAKSKGQRIDFDELEKSALGWALSNLRHLVAPRGGK